MDRIGRRAEAAVISQWAPVFVVVALSLSGVGATQPWSGSSAGQVLASLALGLPLALRGAAPLIAAAAVSAAAVGQVPLGDSLSFGTFLAVLVAAYGVGRHEDAPIRALIGTAVVMTGAVIAGSMESAGMTPDVVIPVVYVSIAAALGRLVRQLAAQADRLRDLNESLEREREHQARLAVATERLRIARELHDVVAHRLTLMVIQAEAGVETIVREPAAARDSLLRIQEAGRQGLDDLRGVVRVLRADSDGVAAPHLADLEALVAVLHEAGLDVSLERDGALTDVAPAVQEAAFRIVQEALTNVLKHSDADRATVSVRLDSADLRIEVRDPGPAVTSDAAGGHGLRGMFERLSVHGGVLEAGPDGVGYRVSASVPA